MSFLPVARVINLDRSPDRLAAIGARLAAAGIAWQRHAATGPATVEEARSNPLYRGARMRALFGREMSLGEIGCFLSHVAAMEAALADDAPLALILEDDAVPFDGAGNVLESVSQWMCHKTEKPVEWLHLSRSIEKWSRPLASVGGIGIKRAYRPPLMANASLYTRKGYQDFLLHVRRYGMDRPVDDALRACFCRSALAAVLEKPIFGEDGSVSTIDQTGGRTSGHNKIIRLRRKIPDYAWASLNILRGV